MLDANISRKIDAVRGIIQHRNAAGLLVTRTSNFAWLTGGRDNHVRTASDFGASFLFITPASAALLANNIETPRMLDEEDILALGYESCVFPWHEKTPMDVVRARVGDGVILSDSGMFGTVNVEGDLAPFRLVLDPVERGHLGQAGRIASDSIQRAAEQVAPGMTEHEAAALLAREVMAHGAIPAVTLVGSDQRIAKYRHPVPTTKRIERLVMLVLGARFRGLIASCTRLVHFGRIPGDLAVKHDAVCRIDATFILGTRPGRSIGEIFSAAQNAYREAGFADQWTFHHQGGATGYEPREFLAKPGSPATIGVHQAFAWNPSIAGTKGEDTILVGDRSNTIVTASDQWPRQPASCVYGTIECPSILVR